jgi:unsaturated chondroitin disaccharide hydrolase
MGRDRIDWWTNGFWGGILWQMYRLTGEETYRQEAEELENRLDSVLMNSAAMDHDSGFRWLPTAVTNFG